MERLKNIVKWLVILLVIGLSLVNIFLTVNSSIEQKNHINQRVEDAIKSIQMPKAINGINGMDGKDGKDSLSTHTVNTVIKQTITKETIQEKGDKGEKGSDGLTPILRCNESKNRWEVKYTNTETWAILGDIPVKCTIESNV